MLCRICSFETLADPHHEDLYISFVDKMDAPVQVINRMLKQHIKGLVLGSTPTPMIQCAVSLLNSVYYHLYGSQQLASMKRLLRSPSILHNSEERGNLFAENCSPWLDKALLRAAEALRSDCRLGLKYIQKVAPHRFAPLCATACCESGMFGHYLNLPTPHLNESQANLTSLERSSSVLVSTNQELILPPESVTRCSCEINQRSNCGNWRAVYEDRGPVCSVMLSACAELLAESSVWKCKCIPLLWGSIVFADSQPSKGSCTVSKKLVGLSTQIKLSQTPPQPPRSNETL